jgi:hypothetical protein
MIEILVPVEKSLNKFYTENTPKLPKNFTGPLVEYLPWINLFIGVLTLLAAFSLWGAATVTSSIIDYGNRLGAAAGVSTATNKLDAIVWIGLIVLFIEAGLFIASFNPTKSKKKSGWDLLFYAAMVNLLYGIIIAFSSLGGIFSLVLSIIGTAIGLYFLFQIRSYFVKSKSSEAPKSTT